MGRRSKRPDAIPRLRVRKKPSGVVHYYYDHGGKPRREEALGSDYGLAIKRWAEIERAGNEKPAEVITFRYVAEKYRAIVMPTKRASTMDDNEKSLRKLYAFFDDPPCPLEEITPKKVKAFLKWRGEAAQVRANRDKALLSHIWNWAREEGYTDSPNPCAGVKGFKETGRDVYVEDDVFARVYAHAPQIIRDAMDLAYLCGQRVGDVYALDERQVREGYIHVTQGKTKKKRRIELTGELPAVLARIKTRKAQYKVHSTRLLVDDDGQPWLYDRLRRAFRSACDAAGVAPDTFQMRDLRAKAGTDKTDSTDIRDAQQQLGHSNLAMTEHYVRERRGAKVTPTK
jgi:integrase